MARKINPNKQTLVSQLKDFFAENSSQYFVEMIFLYGSWGSGYPHSQSDIDLAIVFSEEIDSQERMFTLITDISYELGNKLNKEVNVIPILKDFPHPMLYYNAIVLGLPIFVKIFDRYISLKNEALYQMEDFSIFGLNWQRKVAENNLGGLKYA